MPDVNRALNDAVHRALRRLGERADVPVQPQPRRRGRDLVAEEPEQIPWFKSAISYRSDTITITTTNQKLKNIESDDKDMLDVKISGAEITKAVCLDLDKYYKRYLNQKIPGLRPVNSLISFVEKHPSKKFIISYNALIMGYVIDSKIYTTLDDFQKDHIIKPELSDYICKYYDETTNKLKVKIVKNTVTNTDYVTVDFLNRLKIKIKDGELSGKIFGKSQEKKSLIGGIFEKFEITKGNSKKIGDTYYITINKANQLNIKDTLLEDKQLKFVFDDIEFIIPDLKGYSLPIDKTIKKGNTVKVSNRKLSLFNFTLLVTDVKTNKTSKRITKNSNNRQLDIINCIAPNGQPLRMYAKDLKLITNANVK